MLRRMSSLRKYKIFKEGACCRLVIGSMLLDQDDLEEVLEVGVVLEFGPKYCSIFFS